MTVPDLISNILSAIRTKFYGDRVREYKRDERALMRAIATWGYEVEQRGWEFTPETIFHDLMELLIEIQRSGADVNYLPVYLQGAIRRRIGQRGEELQAASRSVQRNAAKIVAGIQRVEAVREPSPTELLAMLYRDLRRRPIAGKATAKQPALL